MSLSIHVATGLAAPVTGNYLIRALAWHWQRAGHRVTWGPVREIDSDLGILHIDQTRIPPGSIPGKPVHVPLLNERVRDISKRCFSTLRLRRGDNWSGPVIVKSDLNCFGYPEWAASSPGWGKRIRRQLARLAWRQAGMLPPRKYPVLKSLMQVPEWVWGRPELIVERFMPEMENGYFCLRGWVFFGSQGYAYRLFSREATVKTGTMAGYEILDGPPAELVALRCRYGFDFGKFDYVEIEGRPVLLDINKTPTVAGAGSDPDRPRLRLLAQGLYDFVQVH